MTQTSDREFPLELADRCVKCGLCLPHCPTYEVTQDESESPRGRIMLMQGLATGMLEQSARVEKHLDQCLTCRACEVVCPAQVPYGELIDQGRQMLSAQRSRTPPVASRALTVVLSRNWLRRLMGWGLWLYQHIGLQRLLRNTHILGRGRIARLEAMLPSLTRPGRPASRTTQQHARGRVALFTGCVSEWLESEVLADTVIVLNACGFDVDVPKSQGCCGALYQHNGDLAHSRKLAQNNLEAFDRDYQAVVGIASGCSSQLAEYDRVLGSDEAGSFSGKSMDISHFLADYWPEGVNLNRLEAKVAVHDPCTLRNVLKQAEAPYRLLRKIPGLQVEPLGGNPTCCGAAGNYFITEPEMADRLGEKKQRVIQAQTPDILLTSNVGCAMQLKAQVRKAGLDIPVMHPVSLLRQQLTA